MNNRSLLFFIEITCDSPDLHDQLCWKFCKFLRNYIWRSTLNKKVAILSCNSLNSKLLHGQIWPNRLNQAQYEVFRHFLEFGSLFFLEIAYNDSLQQFLTFSGGKISEKSFWSPNSGQTSQNRTRNYVFCHSLKFGWLIASKNLGVQIWAKIGQEIRVFAIFSSLVHQFFF